MTPLSRLTPSAVPPARRQQPEREGALKLTLPWPPKALSPNGSHGHWATTSAAARSYGNDCYWAAYSDGARPSMVTGSTVPLTVTFHPPTKRRRDRDNLIASFKHGQDAVAKALGVDDSQFVVTYAPTFGEPVKHGAVVVEVVGQ